MKLFLLLTLILTSILNNLISDAAKFTTKTAITFAPEEVAIIVRHTVKASFERPDLAVQLARPIAKGITRAVLSGNKFAAIKVVANSVAGGVGFFLKSVYQTLIRMLSKIKSLFITPREIPSIPPTYYSRFKDGLEAVSISLTDLKSKVYSVNTHFVLTAAPYLNTEALEEGARGSAIQYLRRAGNNDGGGTSQLSSAFGDEFVKQFKLHPSAGFKISMAMVNTAAPMIFDYFKKSIKAFFIELFKLFKNFMTESFLVVKKVAVALFTDVNRAAPIIDPLPAVAREIRPDTPGTVRLANTFISTLQEYRILAGSVAVIAVGGGATVAAVAVAKKHSSHIAVSKKNSNSSAVAVSSGNSNSSTVPVSNDKNSNSTNAAGR